MLAALAALVLLAVYFSLRRKVHYEDVADALDQQTASELLKERSRPD